MASTCSNDNNKCIKYIGSRIRIDTNVEVILFMVETFEKSKQRNKQYYKQIRTIIQFTGEGKISVWIHIQNKSRMS